MSDYIEREAAYPLVKKICDAFHSGEHSVIEMPFLILDWIDDLPAADAREVKRGKWNAVKGALHPAETSAVCSNCGFATMIYAQTFYNFCPNCGADMREES